MGKLTGEEMKWSAIILHIGKINAIHYAQKKGLFALRFLNLFDR